MWRNVRPNEDGRKENEIDKESYKRHVGNMAQGITKSEMAGHLAQRTEDKKIGGTGPRDARRLQKHLAGMKR